MRRLLGGLGITARTAFNLREDLVFRLVAITTYQRLKACP